jgi:hypothetical protein
MNKAHGPPAHTHITNENHKNIGEERFNIRERKRIAMIHHYQSSFLVKFIFNLAAPRYLNDLKNKIASTFSPWSRTPEHVLDN